MLHTTRPLSFEALIHSRTGEAERSGRNHQSAAGQCWEDSGRRSRVSCHPGTALAITDGSEF